MTRYEKIKQLTIDEMADVIKMFISERPSWYTGNYDDPTISKAKVRELLEQEFISHRPGDYEDLRTFQ